MATCSVYSRCAASLWPFARRRKFATTVNHCQRDIVDQGFGLSGSVGAAGFPSGEAYKVGADHPYTRLHRAFLRQTIDLGGDVEKLEAGLNQFSGTQTSDRLVFTVGKIGVPDIFDTNRYAHDPRGDFMNWSIVDTGTAHLTWQHLLVETTGG